MAVSDLADLELSIKNVDLASLWGLNGRENWPERVAGWKLCNLGMIKPLPEPGEDGEGQGDRVTFRERSNLNVSKSKKFLKIVAKFHMW